jgi:co-chaperonin GroES (HSP10)
MAEPTALYDADSAEETTVDSLPTPVGYKLMVAIPEVAEKTAGGIIRPDQLRDKEGSAGIVAMVVSMGGMAYKDEKRFPDGPWCAVGDWVLMRPYSGTRFRVKATGGEYRMINDDTVEAVVPDPRQVVRV